MMPLPILLAMAFDAASATGAPGALPFAAHAAQCAGKEGWSDPAPPVRLYANIYDVGTCGIVVLLVAGDDGLVLIDGATAQAAPSIAANIARLGFRATDVKLLLSSHPHADHAGGLPALHRLTGATLVATAAAKPALESGAAPPADPQAGGLPPFEGVAVGRVVRDGGTVTLGRLRLTAHTTPGHAPGSTSWSWRSCGDAGCRTIVFADSLSAVSAGSYRYVDHPAYVATFRASMAKVGRLRCDILITPHPAASNLYARLAGTRPLVDRRGCADYAAASLRALDRKLADERGAAP